MNCLRSTFLILCLLVIQNLSAQVFYQNYAPAGSKADDVEETDDAGFFLAGSVEEDSTLFLQKVDSLGQLQWSNHLALQKARAISASKTTDGGFVVLTENYPGQNGYKNAAIKLDASGVVVWTTIIENYGVPNGLRDLAATPDGGFIMTGDTRDSSFEMTNWLVKLAANGSISWQKQFGSAFLNSHKILALADGSSVISGGRNGGDVSLVKVDATGEVLWQQIFTKQLYQRSIELIPTVNGGFALMGTTQHPPNNYLFCFVLTTDQNGLETGYFTFAPNNPLNLPKDYEYGGVVQDSDGNFYVPYTDFLTNEELFLAKISGSGVLLSQQTLENFGIPTKIITTTDGHLAITGASASQAFLLKSDLNGNYLNNTISGSVYSDDNLDCSFTTGEAGLSNFIVVAKGQNGTQFFKRVNTDGSYELHVSDGVYQIMAQSYVGLPEFYVQCDTPLLSIGVNQTIADQALGIHTVAECPMLAVTVAEGVLRKCLNTSYYVSVQNFGNVVAENVSVQVTADPALTYVSSSMPWTSQNGQVFSFDLPDLEPGALHNLNIQFLVSCDAEIGKVICVEAHAAPDSSCLPGDPNWDGSQIEVSGKCENGNISFKIRNNSNSPMTNSLDYVIIEDHIMFQSGAVQLGANQDSTIVIENPEGVCYVGKVDENDTDHSSRINQPGAVVANCLNNGNLYLALQFDLGSNNLAIANTCGQVVGSFDPNDKQGIPSGWADHHQIEQNQEIEYQIRFQNTGNDTAFLVVIIDTLSVGELDPASFQPIAASHPYTWDLSEKGIAKFSFQNILLPDSNTNEAESHGFIRFKIRQQPNLPYGTLIKNDAAIYFDFNTPIITNEFYHTVGSPHVVATKSPEVQLVDFQVIPNPISASATFILEGKIHYKEVQFSLFDALGNKVQSESFEGNIYPFKKNNVPAGIYFFRMETQGQLLTAGKVIIR